MNDLFATMIEFFGTSVLMSISNIYTITLTFYGALFIVLWYFRRGERYKMFPNEACVVIYISLFGCSLVVALGQYLDPKMQYYPFAFFSNLVLITAVLVVYILVRVIKYMVKIRERFPKQD